MIYADNVLAKLPENRDGAMGCTYLDGPDRAHAVARAWPALLRAVQTSVWREST